MATPATVININTLCNRNADERVTINDGGFDGELRVLSYGSAEELLLVDAGNTFNISADKNIDFTSTILYNNFPISALPIISAGVGDGTSNLITLLDENDAAVPYVANTTRIYIKNRGLWFPEDPNGILAARGVDYDYQETSPSEGKIKPRIRLGDGTQYIVFGLTP